MATDRDDDALSWAGDDDPTLVPGALSEELPTGWSVAGRHNDESQTGQTRADQPRAGQSHTSAAQTTDAEASVSPAAAATNSFTLVAIGVIAGIYLLYTVGWFIGGQRIGNPITDPVGEFMFSLGAWLAVASPFVWFTVTYWLTARRPRARVVWLLVGVVLLAPLPFIFGTGAAA
ncbi:hypothetical protein [Glaciibacter superstes]|uniref:hypothetical protein n=1 Tax=Glaciibacter superstes TaxID=501023 RepID=UPI0003B3A971|nr:hypothetical protein [Glaciibacter superstes]